MRPANPQPKTEPKPEPNPEPPKIEPQEPPKEIETVDRVEYGENSAPRLYAYNLFGELEPIAGNKKMRDVPSATPPKKPEVAKPLPKTGYRRMTDKELEFYGSLNWDDNPPINGFYEAMMNIAYRQIEERRLEQEAAEAAKAQANGETIHQDGVEIQKTEGDFIPTAKPVVEAPKPVEIDMSPRKFSEDIQFFHHNGSMVV